MTEPAGGGQAAAPAPYEPTLASSGQDAVSQGAAVPSDELPFRPDVEGLRAVAVILVVLYHAHVKALSGGFVGVDVFFVISGYLITGLLLREHARRRAISIVRFYARRVRRILPAAMLVIVATLVAAHIETNGFAYAQYDADAKWAILFMANFHFAWQHLNYFELSNVLPSPVLHFWSLAVEEQFYLVWPTLVMITALVLPRVSLQRKVLIVATIAVVVSYIYSVHLTHTNETWAYYSPLSRAWELGAGAMAAASAGFTRRLPKALGIVMALLGLGAIVLSGFVANPTFYPGEPALLPILGTVAVVVGGSCSAGASVLLALPPVRAIGRVSYGWYLLHYPPMIIFSGISPSDSLPTHDRLLIALATLGLAFCMYWLYEKPIRRSKVLNRHPWLSILMGAALVAGAFIFAVQFQKLY